MSKSLSSFFRKTIFGQPQGPPAARSPPPLAHTTIGESTRNKVFAFAIAAVAYRTLSSFSKKPQSKKTDEAVRERRGAFQSA